MTKKEKKEMKREAKAGAPGPSRHIRYQRYSPVRTGSGVVLPETRRRAPLPEAGVTLQELCFPRAVVDGAVLPPPGGARSLLGPSPRSRDITSTASEPRLP